MEDYDFDDERFDIDSDEGVEVGLGECAALVDDGDQDVCFDDWDDEDIDAAWWYEPEEDD